MKSKVIFRQLFEPISSTYSYLLGCGVTRQCVLIDGVLEEHERDLLLIDQLKLDLKYCMNTHIHADHVISTQELKKVHKSCQSVHGDPAGKADVLVKDGDVLQIGESIALTCLFTPGHTDGCFCYFFNNEYHPMLFTGDTMLIRGCGRTDFQMGGPDILFDSIMNQIYTLNDQTAIFPGHDYKGRTQSSIEEEKLYNLRIFEGQSKGKFVDIMDNLNLSPPKNIEYNVSENRVRH